MHNRWYYRNSNGNLDPHAMKIAWKNHDYNKNEMRKYSAVTDWNTNYDYYKTDVEDTLWVNIDWLNTNRKNTQLALRNNLSLVPIDKYNVGHALKEGNFSMVPMEKAKPVPIKPTQIILTA